MRVRSLIPLGLVAVFVFAAPGSASADPIYLTVRRLVSVFNINPPLIRDEDGLGSFDFDVSGADATGFARATQSSTVGPEGISALGTTESRLNAIIGPVAQTSISTTFSLLTAQPFSLDATLFHSGKGVDSLSLFSFATGTFLVEHQTFDPGSYRFQESGVLPAGVYSFAMAVENFDGSGGFNGQLATNASPTPEPATLLLTAAGVATVLARRKRSWRCHGDMSAT